MTLPDELLFLDQAAKKTIAALDSLGLRYAVTGGVASITYGNPRTTNDIDFVLDIPPGLPRIADRICKAFEDDFYISLAVCQEALEHKTMFQALDKENFYQVDLHVSGLVPNQFDRTRLQSLATGTQIPMVSPEDAILSKLVWIKMGSGRSKQDVVAMLRIQTDLDVAYLEQTAKELDVFPVLEEMRGIVERNDPLEIY